MTGNEEDQLVEYKILKAQLLNKKEREQQIMYYNLKLAHLEKNSETSNPKKNKMLYVWKKTVVVV